MPSRRSALLCGLGAALQLLLPAQNALSATHLIGSRKAQVWGYYPVWMQATWKRLNLGLWDRVILFEFPITANAKIDVPDKWHNDWQAMAQALEALGTNFDLAFTLLDEGRFNHLFARDELRRELLQQILAAAKLERIRGIHLDIEIFRLTSEEALAGYRDFMAKLREQLQRLPKPRRPVLSGFFTVGGERDLMDAKTLSYLDYVVVQGYDAHWAESKTAGPIAPLRGTHKLSWEKTLKHILSLGVARSRILFSVPYFGYEWPVESGLAGAAAIGHGITTTYAPVDARLLPRIRVSVAERTAQYPIQRDPDSGSPYYTYQTPDGRWYQGWFEDRTSLAEKFDFINREKLGGVTVFPIGYDAGMFDRLIAEKFGIRQGSGR